MAGKTVAGSSLLEDTVESIEILIEGLGFFDTGLADGDALFTGLFDVVAALLFHLGEDFFFRRLEVDFESALWLKSVGGVAVILRLKKWLVSGQSGVNTEKNCFLFLSEIFEALGELLELFLSASGVGIV